VTVVRTLCVLTTADEPRCATAAVVAVRDRSGEQRWGCERPAAAALAGIIGARIGQVADWDACGRLLALPWNYR